MARYTEEEDVWKCSQHPSKRRRNGICSVCLADRLAALCPVCANLRPCSCSVATSTSSSASFSLQFSDGISGTGSVGRVSNFIDSEPSFQRSRSAAVFSIFRSARFSGEDHLPTGIPKNNNSSPFSLMSVFRRPKSRRHEEFSVENMEALKMQRSKSVAASIAAAENVMRLSSCPAPAKGKGWYFPSPMKVFRHSKAANVVHERSPLHRG